MSRTALVASQLLYDLILDKQETGATLTIPDMLAFNEVLKVAVIPGQAALNKVLRNVLVKARQVTDSDIWTVEHYLRSGLSALAETNSHISPSKEINDASIDLLSDFWAEKAITGDVLSEDERAYAIFLLNHLEIDWQAKGELDIKPILKKQNKLPGPAKGKKVSFDADAVVPNTGASPRKSPRIQKRVWPASFNFFSRFFK